MRLLLAINNSPHSWEAVRSVAMRPWPPGTIVRVLSAVEAPVPAASEFWYDASGVFELTLRQIVKHYDEFTNRAVHMLAACGLRAKSAVRYGNPRTVIIEEAKDWNADLIVVGRRTHSGIKRWLPGSVAQYIIDHAPCSVEVVQHKQVETTGDISVAA